MNEINKIFKTDEKRSKGIKVNVITFSGHGYTIEGDAIAVIPEYIDGE